jgi:plastocyanin
LVPGIPHIHRVAGMGLAAFISLLLASCSNPGGGTPVASGANCLQADETNTVELHANNMQFSTSCITVKAGLPFTIKFLNDEAQPHNVAVYTDSGKGTELGKGDIITGPNATNTVKVPAQQAGQLYFECNVHPQMNGAIVVTAAEGGPASSSP